MSRSYHIRLEWLKSLTAPDGSRGRDKRDLCVAKMWRREIGLSGDRALGRVRALVKAD